MFASLKNKIREEIGSDVSTVVRNAANIRGISSRHISQVPISKMKLTMYKISLYCFTFLILR